jgi:hypothetical protein
MLTQGYTITISLKKRIYYYEPNAAMDQPMIGLHPKRFKSDGGDGLKRKTKKTSDYSHKCSVLAATFHTELCSFLLSCPLQNIPNDHYSSWHSSECSSNSRQRGKINSVSHYHNCLTTSSLYAVAQMYVVALCFSPLDFFLLKHNTRPEE